MSINAIRENKILAKISELYSSTEEQKIRIHVQHQQ